MIDFDNKSFFKLKQAPEYAKQVSALLIPGEKIVDAYQSMRDGVVFTDKRIIVLNVQGLTGKKRDYTSIPYRKIQTYSVETAGSLDLDAELDIWMSGMGKIRFEFKGKCNLLRISGYISHGVL